MSSSINGTAIASFDFTLSAGTLDDNDFLALWFGSSSTNNPNIGLKANCGTIGTIMNPCTNDLFVRTSGTDAGGNLQDVALGTNYTLMGYLQKPARRASTTTSTSGSIPPPRKSPR